MDWVLLALLAAIYVLALPLLAIVALVRASNAKSEVETLRQAYRELIARLPAPGAAPPSVILSEAPAVSASETPSVILSEAPAVSASETPSVILSEAKDPASSQTASPATQGPLLRSGRQEGMQGADEVSPVILSEAKDPASSQAASVNEQGPSLRSGRQEATPPAPPRPTLTLEQLLGGRALAWVGAAAVTLAGIFLVKYSIDQGWLGPLARVLGAAALGAIFILAGEALRSRDARIAQAMCAAGVAVLYAALFAAVALYELLPRSVGLALAALLTALSVMLALRQGPFVALLGLVGGALAPAILSSGSNDAWTLFAYLLALSSGVAIVARARAWWWLGWCALGAALLWAALWLRVGYQSDGVLPVALFLVAVGALFAWATAAQSAAPASDDATQWLGWSALIGGLALGALLAVRSSYQAVPLAAFVVLGLAMLWRLRGAGDGRQYLALVWPALSLLVLQTWSQALLPALDTGRFALSALALGGVASIAAYALVWHGAARPRAQPQFWAALAAGSALLHFGAVCAALYYVDVGLRWGAIALLLAAALAIAAAPVLRARARQGMDEAASVLVTGAIVFVSLAVPLELRREWVTMAYALELPIVAWLARRLALPLLRYALALLVGTITVRLVFNPYVLDYDVSANPLLNWVLYGYGAALLSYWLTARLLKPAAADALGAALLLAVQASMLAFGFLLLSLEVRSIFHPEGLGVARFETMERGWTSLAWGAMALALIFQHGRRPHPVLLWGGRIVGAIALSTIAVGALLWLDGLFVPSGGGIGGRPILNGLIVLFGAPALLAGAAEVLLRRAGQTRAAAVAGGAALVLGFAFFSYEIRHWFNFADGARAVAPMRDAELYAYSIVWLLLGAALLVGGIVQRSTVLRYASLAVLVLVVAKVFLVDMSGLTGLLRVASFLGLGIGLLALGFIYRRYVFADDRAVASG